MLELRDDVDLPLVHFQRLGEVLAVDRPSSEGETNSSIPRRIDSMNGGFQPISANFPLGHESDWEAIQDDLERAFDHIDLLEPFDRIATAINALAERDDRFR